MRIYLCIILSLWTQWLDIFGSELPSHCYKAKGSRPSCTGQRQLHVLLTSCPSIPFIPQNTWTHSSTRSSALGVAGPYSPSKEILIVDATCFQYIVYLTILLLCCSNNSGVRVIVRNREIGFMRNEPLY